MERLFRKVLWKDIIILIILVGITFMEYTTFKKIEPVKISYIIVSILTCVYAFFYTLYHCQDIKQRKWLVLIYSISILFLYPRDMLDVFIYLLVAVIFLENREKGLSAYFIISTSFICFTMICYFFELIPARDMYRGDELRYGLGFVHPNTVFRYFFGSLMCLYILDKSKIYFNIYAISVAIPLYLLTDSRTGLICVAMFVVLANVGIVFKKHIEHIDFKYSYLLVTLFSIVFVIIFHDSNFFNELLSARPSFLYDILINSKWHLLTGHMEYTYCDNRIFYLLVRDGAVALFIVNAFYYVVFKKEQSVELKIIFIMAMIYGLTENFRDLGQSVLPLLCLWSLYDNYLREKKQNLQLLINNDK